MDLDSPSASPLDEVTRLRRELDRVTQEAALLRAQISPPLSEANLLQLLAASPGTPWVHALGEFLLAHIRSATPSAPTDTSCPSSTLAQGVWLTLQQFGRQTAPSPSPITNTAIPLSSAAPLGHSPALPTQGNCFNCGLPGHWARHCRQPRPPGRSMPSSTIRQGSLSVLPSGHTIFTSASGRTYDTSAQPPYPCGLCQQWHWYWQPCSARTSSTPSS